MDNFGHWLADIGLEQYLDTFIDNKIDADVLADLTEEDLEKLSVPLGDRKRLIKAIRSLDESSDVDPSRDNIEPPAANGSMAEDESTIEAPADKSEEQRQLTLMFVDLVGSTTLSQQLSLEEFRSVIREYLSTGTRIIREFDGFIPIYQGDGLMAYFGYPRAEEDDAEQAVAAGLAVVRAVSNIETVPGVALKARVGIATGQVVVGDLISDHIAIKATVSGGTPSLAARLQSLAAPGTVVVSESTRNLLGTQLVCEFLGRAPLKGFSQPVPHWRVLEIHSTPSRFESRQRGVLTPFVDRVEEVELLRRRWERAKTGKGQAVLISGESGIGKSRLVQVMCDHISGEPHIRLRYQCSPHYTGSALYPIISQMEFASGFSAQDNQGQKLDKLEQLISQGSDDVQATAPLFAKLLGIPAEDRYGRLDLSSAQIKSSILKTLLGQLFGLVEFKPVLIIFEDLHWIDPTSQELLDLMMDEIEQLPVLLLCTYRSEYVAPWIGQAAVTTMHVNRLDLRQSAAMVEQVSGKHKLPADVTQAVLAKTDGVPLFLEELTKTVLETDTLRHKGGLDTLEGRLEELALPATLKDSLRARLDRLPSAKSVVPVGAAIGRTFSYKLLATVTALEHGVLRPVLDQLVHAQLLYQRGQPPDTTYTFKHALVQDVAYDTMLRSKMRKLHARIALTLEEDFPEIAGNNPEILAHHHTRALAAAKACDWWRRAAAVAIDRSANVEAIAHLEAALEQNERTDNKDKRVETEISLREMLCVPLEARSWGSGDIEDNLNRLHELREARGDEEELFSVLHGLCGTHLIGGQIQLANDFGTKMLRIAEQSKEDNLLVLSHHALGMCAFFSGDFKNCIDHFETSLRIHEQSAGEIIRKYYVADLPTVAQSMLSWAYQLDGATTNAARAIEAAMALADDQEHAFSKAYGYSIAASYFQTRDDVAAALRCASTALQLSQENHFPYWEAWSLIVKGWAMVAAGDHAQGLSALRHGIDEYAKTGSRQIVPYAQTLLADAYLRIGRIADGLAVIRELTSIRESNEVRFYDLRTDQIGDALRAAQASGAGSAAP